MPVIKSAKKKLRQDKKATLERAKFEETMKDAVKKAVASTTVKTVTEAVSFLDKAAKKHIMHANKAARIKSRLAHLLNPKGAEKKVAKTESKPTAAKKTVKKPAKKTSTKKTK